MSQKSTGRGRAKERKAATERPDRSRSRKRESTAAVQERTATEKQLVKAKDNTNTHTTAYIQKRMYRTQRRHTGVCIKYRPMRRLVKCIAARQDNEGSEGVTQITEGAVRCVQELVEPAVISILRQAIERREENGGKKLMEQNLLNAFLAWASFQDLDFVQDFAKLADALGWKAERPQLTPVKFMGRADSVRLLTVMRGIRMR